MADGITTLATLNWGTSTGGAAGSGETTATLGVDRQDSRTPPDLTRVWAAQINANKNLLLSMSAFFKGGTRLQVLTQTSNPFGVSESGYYIDTTGKFWGVYNGTPTQLTGGGGGGTGNWSFSGNNADLTGAATMGIGLTTANAFAIGNATVGTTALTTSRLSIAVNATNANPVSAFQLTGAADTARTLSTEVIGANWNFAQIKQWATGAITTQREFVIQAPTYSFLGASTITSAATLAITGAPVAGTNATITNPFALWLQAGNLAVAPAASILNASQGATNTTGLTIASNVADGASSIGLVINNTTTTPSGKILSIQDAGTERGSFSWDGSQSFWKGAINARYVNSSGTGIAGQTNDIFAYSSGTAAFWFSFGQSPWQFRTLSDNNATLGASAAMFAGAYSYAYYTKAQANTVGATFTINPALGSYVKQTLTSATNVTAVTISAGVDGQELVVEVIQPAAGTADTVATTWTNVAFAGGAGSFTATLGKRDIYTFIYNATTSKWNEVGRAVNVS